MLNEIKATHSFVTPSAPICSATPIIRLLMANKKGSWTSWRSSSQAFTVAAIRKKATRRESGRECEEGDQQTSHGGREELRLGFDGPHEDEWDHRVILLVGSLSIPRARATIFL